MAIKSILTASVLSVIGAAVSTAAFADVNASTFCKPGFYAGLQGGRSDTFYHPNSAMIQATNDNTGTQVTTYTLTNGEVYRVDYDTRTNQVIGPKTDDIGLGGRIYAGYQFNPYFAVEAGYTQYAKTSSHQTNVNSGNTTETFPPYGSNPGSPSVTNADVQTLTNRYNGEITEHAIDLVAKGTLPLQYGFGVYGKLGAAYVQADNHINKTLVSFTETSSQIDPSATSPVFYNRDTLYTKTYQKFAPVAGVGVNYTIPNTNMSVNADYTRVFTYGGIPNASLASLGIEYKFA